MKLTKLQQQKIENIIKQEMHSLKEGWRNADTLTRNSRINEKNLFEVSSPLENDLSETSLSHALEQVISDEANSCLASFDNELFMHIASVLISHGVVDSSVEAEDIHQQLTDHNEPLLIDAQQECAMDIIYALEKYVKEISSLIIKSVSLGQQ